MSGRRYHIIFGTYGSWLPGDPRGFRTRHHRMHVEGDYRSPPPPGTYERLHADVKRRMRSSPVTIPRALRPVAGEACLEQFAKEGAEVVVLSVGGQHVHVAAVCPAGDLKQLVGRVKKVSSHRVRAELPGRIWGIGCRLVQVRDDAHWQNVMNYISNQKDAWTWRAEWV